MSEQSAEVSTEVAIIGAGPIGLELAVALKKASIDYIVFDAQQIGFTISWFPPQTQFFSSNERIAIAGVPLQTPNQAKATREEYLTYLRTVVEMFDLKLRIYERIEQIGGSAGNFTLASKRGTYRARRIVLCTGGTDRPRTLGIPGENLPHVSHVFGDPHTYFQTDLLIIGGKNSAVETALRCTHAGARVAISYRKPELPARHIKYWLMPEIQHYIKTDRITAHFSTQPVEITPTHVTLSRGQERFDVPARFVLPLIGYEQDKTIFHRCGVELIESEQSPRFNEQTMETNVPGIYVAGTAVGGTQQRYSVFIENCHVHVARIVAALTGAAAPPVPVKADQPES